MKKIFKYSHNKMIKFRKFELKKENYSNYNFNSIPKKTCIILLLKLPIEVIGIIWNITRIMEDIDCANYVSYVQNPNSQKLEFRMALRSSKALYSNCNQFGVYCNYIASFIYDTKISNDNKIKMVYKSFIKWYELLNNNTNKHIVKLKRVLIDKIFEFKNIFDESTVKRNKTWYNTKQKEKLYNKLKDCVYYIDNYNFIVGQQDTQSHKCKEFNNYLNYEKYKKYNSFHDYYEKKYNSIV